MSYEVTLKLFEPQLDRDAFERFLDLVAALRPTALLSEVPATGDDEVRAYFFESPARPSRPRAEFVRLWFSVRHVDYTRKVGRSRRRVRWEIDVSTNYFCTAWSFATQLSIPLLAFRCFNEIVVCEGGDLKTMFDVKTYLAFARSRLLARHAEAELRDQGILLPDGRLWSEGDNEGSPLHPRLGPN